jgi:hypothetical protein
MHRVVSHACQYKFAPYVDSFPVGLGAISTSGTAALLCQSRHDVGGASIQYLFYAMCDWQNEMSLVYLSEASLIFLYVTEFKHAQPFPFSVSDGFL